MRIPEDNRQWVQTPRDSGVHSSACCRARIGRAVAARQWGWEMFVASSADPSSATPPGRALAPTTNNQHQHAHLRSLTSPERLATDSIKASDIRRATERSQMPRLLKSFGTSTLMAGHGQAQPSVFETEFEPPPYFFVSNSQGRSCSDAGRTSSGNQAVKRPTLRT